MGKVKGENLLGHIARLARFGANLSDAYSCCIFLPNNLFNSKSSSNQTGENPEVRLQLVGSHSLSKNFEANVSIPLGSGFIGWVGRYGQPIHVSPFERDSRTLGIYSQDEKLKSFMAVPIRIPFKAAGCEPTVGVLCCDSKKSFAFSKLQGKLLNELSSEVCAAISLWIANKRKTEATNTGAPTSWNEFMSTGLKLARAIGPESLEIIRIKLEGTSDYERRFGLEASIGLYKQFDRLLRQLLPANFPTLCLPNGEFVAILDSMTTSFYSNKLRVLTEHMKFSEIGIDLNLVKRRYQQDIVDANLLAKEVTKVSFAVDTTFNQKRSSHAF